MSPSYMQVGPPLTLPHCNEAGFAQYRNIYQKAYVGSVFLKWWKKVTSLFKVPLPPDLSLEQY